MILADKVAIVSGAGQGIGLCICKKLVSEGAIVVLNDVDPALAEKAAGEAAGGTGRCIAVPGDSGNMNVIHQLVTTAVSQFGRLDIAIANAGITLFGDFFSYEKSAFDRVMQVNLGGTFFLAQAAALQMKKQGKGWNLVVYVLSHRPSGAQKPGGL
jgi:3-oxoacyl-[acyl-carrier protein] reductase